MSFKYMKMLLLQNLNQRSPLITDSPEQPKRKGRPAHRSSDSPEPRSSSEMTNEAEAVPIVNHVVNQLAFSRLSSTPLSVIMTHLPADLKGGSPSDPENRGLTKQELCRMLNAAPCIGEIRREGKDAAGKALESEYYYIPDADTDETRRAAVFEKLQEAAQEYRNKSLFRNQTHSHLHPRPKTRFQRRTHHESHRDLEAFAESDDEF
ncbi:putative protein PLM2 [Glarea lozoyensis 74030]|uniref:Uncharacterized protein n=1 Tax=Glarea lozoyensis (strain ATCC 74030 / MF5533) TaxID=1104152 RepID=H0ELR6_GLAL7|nr:putative protein PLM2 [Glarea lozoyensis 74030]